MIGHDQIDRIVAELERIRSCEQATHDYYATRSRDPDRKFYSLRSALEIEALTRAVDALQSIKTIVRHKETA